MDVDGCDVKLCKTFLFFFFSFQLDYNRLGSYVGHRLLIECITN